MALSSITPDLIPTFYCAPSEPQRRTLSQPTALWMKFRRRFKDTLSKRLGTHRATQLINRCQHTKSPAYVPGPSEYLPFAFEVLEPIIDGPMKGKVFEQVVELVIDLTTAS